MSADSKLQQWLSREKGGLRAAMLVTWFVGLFVNLSQAHHWDAFPDLLWCFNTVPIHTFQQHH